MKKYIIILLSLVLSIGYSQCPVHVKDSLLTIQCGDSIVLSAYKDTLKPLNINFNDGLISSSLIASPNARIADTSNYSCFGLPPEGRYYLFMTNTIDSPRFVETIPLNLIEKGANKATLCFRMKYGTQDGNGSPNDPCEGIEASNEGIYLEYFVDKWITLQYWNPNPMGGQLTGGHEINLINWNKYCFNLPKEALTNHTKIRWIQKNSDGIGFDTWAIDDISIVLESPEYSFSWSTEPISKGYSVTVKPTKDQSYIVTYSSITESCAKQVKVLVIEPIDVENAPIECQCQYLFIPNAFTPNGDGINDYFSPIVFGIKEYSLDVFNRYGQIIFHTNNRLEQWSGDNQAQDTYTYVLKIRNLQNVNSYHTGIIALIK